MKKKLDLRFAWVVSLIGFIQPVSGQTDSNAAVKDERDILTTIATYPTDLRSAVLDVAQYPQELVKLERIQARSSQSFQDLIAGYSREEQEKFYEVSRFPDRLDQLVSNGRKSPEEVKQVLADLPAATQSRIAQAYNDHFGDLRKMNALYQASQDAMDKIISDYPMAVQADFRKVVSKPEVMNLLTENIDVTVRLGEDYRDNPTAVIAQLDSLNTQYQQDFANYKKEVENNPEMQQELKSAADGFTSSYDQNDSPVGSYLDNQPATYNTAPVVNNYNYYGYNPYPYWFSYPYWYATPVWYPVPYYYHTGFYYGPGGRIVICGFPSYSYSNWFFSFGYRHYPRLYSRYHVYYHGYYGHAGREGRYAGYNHSRNGRGSRTYTNAQGNRSGNSNRTSSYQNRTTANQNQTTSWRNRTSSNQNRISMDYNRTLIHRSPTVDNNNNRSVVQSNRSATVKQNLTTTWNSNRTTAPVHQNVVRPSGSNNSRGSQQFHPSSVTRSSGHPSVSGGSRGNSGNSGGSRGGSGGGGGRRGR